MPLFRKKLVRSSSSASSPLNSPSKGKGLIRENHCNSSSSLSEHKVGSSSLLYQNGDISHSFDGESEDCLSVLLLVRGVSSDRAERRKSCLSKSLVETLQCELSREQLHMYLESCGGPPAKRLLQFWLDADSFETSANSRLRLQVLQSHGQGVSCSYRPETGGDSSSSPSVSGHSENQISSHHHTTYTQAQALHQTSDVITCDKLMKSIQRDAVNLYSKYISQDSADALDISDDMRNRLIGEICREDNQVDPLCFVPVKNFVISLIEKQYFSDFIQSGYNFKDQVDILTSGTIQLEDVLFNHMAFFYFMEYVEKEGGMPLLEFWLCVDNFKQNLLIQQREGSYDGQLAQEDAMVIYDKYFSLQATRPIGFTDSVRFDVEASICRDGGPLPQCFDAPRNIVLNSIDQNYYASYLSSDVYYKYLSELISSSRSATASPGGLGPQGGGGQHRRSGSETSSVLSEVGSVSSQNTLLASPSSEPGHAHTQAVGVGVGARHSSRHKGHAGKVNMQIDADRFNPDSLWRRRVTASAGSGNLSLGRVSELGKFETLFEPEPDKKDKGSLFGKAVKKFVNKQEDKEKEDMAWQVAQMIIRDITSITQSVGDDNDTGGGSVSNVASSDNKATNNAESTAATTNHGYGLQGDDSATHNIVSHQQ